MIEFSVSDADQVFNGEYTLKIMSGGVVLATHICDKITLSIAERLRELFSGEFIKEETAQIYDSIDTTEPTVSGDEVKATVVIGGSYIHESPERSGTYQSHTTISEVLKFLQFGTSPHVIESASPAT